MKRPSITGFQKIILEWHEENGRHGLPWRKTHDPYHILVSEIMLQQTQVDRVIPKFEEFLKTFPTMTSLVSASASKLLTHWKGLGYNRRALNLQRACGKILSDHDGVFPADPKKIDELPGVGHYTARAVAVFSFNTPQVFIETNIRRVFIHYFFQDQATVSDDELLPLIKKALYVKNPRLWYGALMDYGALALKNIPNPNLKSSQYSKQSRFEGSRRYARAKILDCLLANKKPQGLKSIQAYCKKDRHLEPYLKSEPLRVILDALVKDGFCERRETKWHVRL